MEAVATKPAFDRLTKFWTDRAAKGNGFLAKPVEHQTQTARIQSLIMTRLKPTDFFRDAIDFGCGYGRFISTLANYCGHIWAIDLAESFLGRIGANHPNVTPVKANWPVKLECPQADLLWASLVFQHITDPALFATVTMQLSKALKPGARVLIVDNATDRAGHVCPRTPAEFAQALGLKPGFFAEKVTLNSRPFDHWLIDGFKG